MTGSADHPLAQGNPKVFETEIALKRHVEYLPMYGQKTQVNYPGIPRMRNHFYIVGHLRRDCNNKKKDWIEFIIGLIEEEDISIDMVGSWKAAINRWKNANQNPKEKS